MITNLSELPPEILLNILSFLSPTELLKAIPQASKQLRLLAYDSSLWRDSCRQSGVDVDKYLFRNPHAMFMDIFQEHVFRQKLFGPAIAEMNDRINKAKDRWLPYCTVRWGEPLLVILQKLAHGEPIDFNQPISELEPIPTEKLYLGIIRKHAITQPLCENALPLEAAYLLQAPITITVLKKAGAQVYEGFNKETPSFLSLNYTNYGVIHPMMLDEIMKALYIPPDVKLVPKSDIQLKSEDGSIKQTEQKFVEALFEIDRNQEKIDSLFYRLCGKTEGEQQKSIRGEPETLIKLAREIRTLRRELWLKDKKDAAILLPAEMWHLIFSLGILNKLDLRYASMACKLFNELITSSEAQLIKNSPWPLPDYTKHLIQRDQIFYTAESNITSLVQLKNGDFLCGLSNGKILVLDSEKGESSVTLDGHLDCIKKRADADARLRRMLSMFGTSADTMEFNPHNQVQCLFEHSDGQILSGADDAVICVYDATYEIKKKLTEHAGHIIGIDELDNESKDIISGSNHGDLIIWDVENWAYKEKLSHPELGIGISSLAALRHGFVVAGCLNGSLCIWDLKNKKTASVKGHADAIRTITLFDDQTLITGSSDKTLRLWDIDSWKCLRVFRGHSQSVHSVTKIDEKYIVSGSADKTIRLWDVQAGVCIHTLTGHTDFLTALLAKNNGDIVSASDDNSLRLWRFGYLDPRQDPEDAVIAANEMKL